MDTQTYKTKLRFQNEILTPTDISFKEKEAKAEQRKESLWKATFSKMKQIPCTKVQWITLLSSLDVRLGNKTFQNVDLYEAYRDSGFDFNSKQN